MPYVSKKSLGGLPRAEYVYLLQDVEMTGLYKIGKTNRPKGRVVDDFGVKLPFEVEVLRMMPTYNATKLERELHRKYEHRRVNGEWFDLQENEVLEILCMPSQLEPPQGTKDDMDRLYSIRPLMPDKLDRQAAPMFGLRTHEIQSRNSLHSVFCIIHEDTPMVSWTNPHRDYLGCDTAPFFDPKFPASLFDALLMARMLTRAVDILSNPTKEKFL